MNPEQRTGTSDSDGDLYLSENELTRKAPSAPPQALGTALLHIRVKWPEGHIPRKDFALRKALQSWLRKDLGSAVEIESLQLEDATEWAKVEIYPSTALDIVLDQQFAQLKLKDSRIITLDFHRDISEPLTSVKDLEQAAAETDTSTSEIILPAALTVATNGKDSASQDTLSNASHEMRVSLAHSWYLNEVYRQEIERLQKEYRVKIHSDAVVRIEADKDATSDSMTNACQEFANLFQRCSNNLETLSLPNMLKDSTVMTHFMKDILGEERKLMLSVSGQNWSLFGPEENITTVQAMLDMNANMDDPRINKGGKPKHTAASKDLHKEPKCNLQREAQLPHASVLNLKGHVNANRDLSTSKKPIKNLLKEVNLDSLKDPLLTDGILMSSIHWEIMRRTFKMQIENIQTKFGVALQENRLKDEMKVRVVGNHPHSLEVNAIRALMCLYQKVIMTTMCCPSQNVSHTQAEMVELYLSNIRKQNPSLVVGEGTTTNGVWMMIGLPDHLRFAVGEIEKNVGGPVFDGKHKHMIGYNQATEFLRPFPNRPAWEGAMEYEGVKKKKSPAGGATHEDSVEQRRADKGMKKGTGRERVHGHDGGILQDQFLENETLTGGNVPGWDKENRAFLKADQAGLGGDTGKLGDPDISEGYKAQNVKGAGRPYSDGKMFSGGNGVKYKCPICMDEFNNKEKLSCDHAFCKDCLRQSVASLGPNCPLCKKVFQKVEGDQPDGTMTHLLKKSTLPGFKRCDTIIITYHIPSGIQSINHPNPGKRFKGAHLTAYLPAIREGWHVLELLKKAFDQRLVFTVGTSQTGGEDCVIWNGIHHKTSTYGGLEGGGYPDDSYLQRVREELKAKGIE